MNPIKYLHEKGLRRTVEVAWRYKLPKLQIAVVRWLTKGRPLQNKILIESHDDFDCNGGALYDYLVESGRTPDLRIVWLLNRPACEKLPEGVSWVPLYGPSFTKAWHVCTAKWLVADSSITEKVRADQTSLYMTHGVFGLKNAKDALALPGTVDFVLSPSPEMDDVIREYRSVADEDTRLVHLGYPSLDRLYGRKHSKKYRIPVPNQPATILWMPTFRKSTEGGRIDSEGLYPYGIPLIDTEEELKVLAKCVRDRDAELVIKLHPKQDLTNISKDAPDGIRIVSSQTMREETFDTYDLMIDSSALVTDYSGAAFEYIALNKPIGFVLSDLEDYKLGLVDNYEKYMPGEKILSFADLAAFIESVCDGIDEHEEERLSFRRWFYTWNDAEACARVASFLGV